MSFASFRNKSNANLDSRINDLRGRVFGRLTVECDSGQRQRRAVLWRCKCSCGQYINVRGDLLQTGNTRSCGCLFKDVNSQFRVLATNALYRSYINNAAQSNRIFELSIEQFIDLTSSVCHYCGIEPYNVYKMSGKASDSYAYNGLDRKDNAQGYTLENSLPCCKICNRAKNNMDYEDFMKWIQRIKNAQFILVN